MFSLKLVLCKKNLPHLSQGKVNYAYVDVSSAYFGQCHANFISHIYHKEQIKQANNFEYPYKKYDPLICVKGVNKT